jgi:hypothetical protein
MPEDRRERGSLSGYSRDADAVGEGLLRGFYHARPTSVNGEEDEGEGEDENAHIAAQNPRGKGKFEKSDLPSTPSWTV